VRSKKQFLLTELFARLEHTFLCNFILPLKDSEDLAQKSQKLKSILDLINSKEQLAAARSFAKFRELIK